MGCWSKHGRASLGNELSRPSLACLDPSPGPVANGTQVGDKNYLKVRIGLQQRVDNEVTQGARRGSATFVIGHWEAWGSSKRALDLRGSRTPVPLGLAKW